MNLQLDTTISYHKLLDLAGDKILEQYLEIAEKASAVYASTFSRKEMAFSLIYDCCLFLQKLIETNSFVESYQWIDQYSSRRKRFGPRMHNILSNFIVDQFGTRLRVKDKGERDRLLAQKLKEYLRVTIPELWDRFEVGIDLPLKDRTKCTYGNAPPKEIGEVFVQKKKNRCKSDEGCALRNMILGEKERAEKLLDCLKRISNSDDTKTEELKKIQGFLEDFFDKGQYDKCFEMCNVGIGDLVIALETPGENTLITTNEKETRVISPAIGQKFQILKRDSA